MTSVTEGTKVRPPLEFERELEVACRAALQAGRVLMHRYGAAAARPEDSPSVEAGRASDQVIRATITNAFGDDAILAESSQDTGDRLQAARVWIVDPLDGAREFAEGRSEFSVMIALLQESVLRVGVVYQPAADVLYYALAGAGAYRSNGHGPEPLRCEPTRNGVRLVAARVPTDPIVEQLCKEDGFTDIETSGSVGLQCARVAEGARVLYVQPAAAMAEWDTAAAELILTEAGGSVTDCFGRRLTYNKRVPLQTNGVLAAHPTVTFRVIPTLARMLNGRRPTLNRRPNGK